MMKKFGIALFSAVVLAASPSYSFANTSPQKTLHTLSPMTISDLPVHCHVDSKGMDCDFS